MGPLQGSELVPIKGVNLVICLCIMIVSNLTTHVAEDCGLSTDTVYCLLYIGSLIGVGLLWTIVRVFKIPKNGRKRNKEDNELQPFTQIQL